MGASGTLAPTATATGERTRRQQPIGPKLSALLRRFPPRPVPPTWAGTACPRERVLARLLEPPFTLENPKNQTGRQTGLIKLLDWLEYQPGHTWQDRWLASGGDAAGNLAWRGLAIQWRSSAALWLVEAAAAGCSRMRAKMAEAVELARLHDAGTVDRALGQAATASRFGHGDLAAILAHQATDAGGGRQRAGEGNSLAQGTAGWAELGEPGVN
jgi:hypothetical protein